MSTPYGTIHGDVEALFRVVYRYVPNHSCPSCSCEEVTVSEIVTSIDDARRVEETVTSKEASATMKIIEVVIEKCTPVWEFHS